MVVGRLLFARMVSSCEGRGAISRALLLLIWECFSFGILRLLDRVNVDPFLAFVSIARLCGVD